MTPLSLLHLDDATGAKIKESGLRFPEPKELDQDFTEYNYLTQSSVEQGSSQISPRKEAKRKSQNMDH